MSSRSDSILPISDNEIIYFAYGSNMCSRRLQARVPSARVRTKACLSGYQLRFHKHSLVDGSAKCDAFKTGETEDIVWGVLFSFDAAERPRLDKVEGVGYEIRQVQVRTADGQTIEALTYLATLINPELKPFQWYKRHVLEGAKEHALPADYIAAIEAVTAMADTDTERCARELGIYR